MEFLHALPTPLVLCASMCCPLPRRWLLVPLGQDSVRFDMGMLRLPDTLAAPALSAWAEALARLPSAVVSRRENHDDW